MDIYLQPRRTSPLLDKKVLKQRMLMNPYSKIGMYILSDNNYSLFKEIDGKTNIKTLADIGKSKYRVTKKHFLEFIHELERHKLIYYSNPQSTVHIQKRLAKEKNDLLSVWLALTNQCNFSCTYCFVKKTKESMSEAVLDKTLTKIFDSAVKNKFLKLKLILAGGEPLLVKNRILFVDNWIRTIGKKYNIQSEIGIITNGSLLNEEFCELLSKKGIFVGISIDGLDNFQNKTRLTSQKTETFHLTSKGMALAKQYKILSNVSITVTSNNVKNLPEFVEYILKTIDTRIVFSLFKGNSSSPTTLYPDTKQLIYSFKKVVNIFYKYNLHNKHQKNKLMLDGLRIYPPMPLLHFCGAGNSYFTVNYKGDVLPCPAVDTPVTNIQAQGDMLHEVLANSSEEYVSDVPTILNTSSACNKCLWKYACSGGCPTERKFIDKSLKSPTTYCTFYKAIIPYAIKLEAEKIIKKHIR